jgi:hypothetical protein
VYLRASMILPIAYGFPRRISDVTAEFVRFRIMLRFVFSKKTKADSYRIGFTTLMKKIRLCISLHIVPALRAAVFS